MQALVEHLSTLLQKHDMMLAAAESCTGGQVSAAITSLSGSSAIFDRGFITYSNDAKHELLDVPIKTLQIHGAVSSEVAESMALGALKNSAAHIAVSVTGIAGPNGGTAEKPVGLVYLGFAHNDKSESLKCNFKGARADIQKQSVEKALKHLIKLLETTT